MSGEQWSRYKTEVEARVDCRKIYGDIKNAKPSGNGHMVGLCPFHEDHKPSFGFDTKTGAWECFTGCGKGSVFDYLGIGTRPGPENSQPPDAPASRLQVV